MPNITHGKSRISDPTYITWAGMKNRCNNPRYSQYDDYGGRGIRVCKRWDKFKNFLSDMGERPAGLVIERIDNDKGYSPDNCKWATRAEQHRNTRRNHLITYKGRTQCLTDWAIELGVLTETLRYRVKKHPVKIAFGMK